MLGMCPTLAVTSSAVNGLGMGLSTTVVLIPPIRPHNTLLGGEHYIRVLLPLNLITRRTYQLYFSYYGLSYLPPELAPYDSHIILRIIFPCFSFNLNIFRPRHTNNYLLSFCFLLQ